MPIAADPQSLYVGAQSWRLYRNSYRNTLAWTASSLFERVFARAELRRALVVYI